MELWNNFIKDIDMQWRRFAVKSDFWQQHEETIISLIPVALQVLIILAMFLIARKIVFTPFKAFLSRWPALEASISGQIKLISFLVLLAICRTISTALGHGAVYIDIAIMGTAAWLIPSFFKSSTLNPAFRRAIILSLWAMLALMVTDKLDPIIQFLDSASFTAGEAKLSLWSVIKVTGIFIILIWSVSTFTQIVDTFMQRSLHITPSARTLITKMVNIAGIVFGSLITLNLVGIDLSMFAFFGGALGIGIGFGLQKIVSNFISGIILVTDKSVKPGDVLTIGEHLGQIIALRARYVVMRKRNGTEVLIPNENLMTYEVVNWSYNNRKVRLEVEVGVSYDSDMEKVREALLETIKENPRVLTTPNPVCFITAFADSSVNFLLRFWIVDPEEGIANIKGMVFMDIWKRFKQDGIEIPFPQRVLHMAEQDNKEPIDS
ncbi:MAG: mechanosensitive ion channel domain-containing protein [Pseudomonadota bacterium]|nr:mechanosensitive ion channel domain-containing protein [Pseudomonadota bacterium]